MRLSAHPSPASWHLAAALGLALTAAPSPGFRDDFDRPIVIDPDGVRGWAHQTGDGTATMTLSTANGHASVRVDATTDRRNIWWALVRRDVSSSIDVASLATPRTELRIEARVRSSHAPRRINLSANTQRTTDFHTNLMEFDLGEPDVWHIVSFTTRDFDARAGDRVNAQLALMDWGLGRYQVDIDYFKVDVVDPATVGPDLGVAVPYRPPLDAPDGFRHALAAAHAATIDLREPDAVLHDWSAFGARGPTRVLGVSGTQHVVLRWDLRELAGRTAAGSGLLQLETHSVRRPASRRKDFGMLRVVEILGGDPRWDERSVSYASLTGGRAYEEVFNTQTIVDVEVGDSPGARTLVTIPRPVLQRLIDGRTRGLALIPLGAIEAAFQTGTGDTSPPTLRLNVVRSRFGDG